MDPGMYPPPYDIGCIGGIDDIGGACMGGGPGVKPGGISIGVDCGGTELVPASLFALLLVTLLEIFHKRISSCKTKSNVSNSELYK